MEGALLPPPQVSGASTGPCPPLPASPSHRQAPWNQGCGVSAGPAWLEVASPWGPSILLPAAATPDHLPDATDPMVLWWLSRSLGSPQTALRATLGWEVFFFVYGLCDCQRLSCYQPSPWARPLSVHSILSVAWAPARTGGLTVQASAREGRACPGQHFGGGTMSLGTSLSPDQWL